MDFISDIELSNRQTAQHLPFFGVDNHELFVLSRHCSNIYSQLHNIWVDFDILIGDKYLRNFDLGDCHGDILYETDRRNRKHCTKYVT